eukprot:gene19329-22993_t
MTRLDPGSGPRRKSSARSVDGRVDLGEVSLGVFANDIRQLRRIDVGRVVGAGNPLATDVVFKTLGLGHEFSPDAKSR